MGEGVNYFVALKNTWVLAEGREGEMVDNYTSIISTRAKLWEFKISILTFQRFISHNVYYQYIFAHETKRSCFNEWGIVYEQMRDMCMFRKIKS